MRPILIADTVLLALAAPLAPAAAAPITFGYTGGVQGCTVATGGTCDILAYGAQGGHGAGSGFVGGLSRSAGGYGLGTT